MMYTHTPKYIYVIIAEQFIITNLSGRTSVRTLDVDCSQWQCRHWPVTVSNIVTDHTTATPTARQPTVPVACKGHCHCHCSEVMLFTDKFHIISQSCIDAVCLLNLLCWWHIKICLCLHSLFLNVNNSTGWRSISPPSLVRVKTKAYSAQSSISIVRFRTVSIGPDQNENRNNSYLFY